jgi:TonB family protein
MNMRAARIVVVCIGMMLATAPRLHAQEPLSAARQLYAAAEYEQALELLEGLPPAVSREERQGIELYRALCLLALGRRADADRALDALVAYNPMYRPADDLSPRLRAAVTDAKRRVLPTLVQQQYTEAKTAYDRKAFADAATAFRRVVDVLNDPDMSQAATQPPLADLRTLASGFHDLSVKAIAPPPPPPPPPPPAPVVLPPRIYSGEERGVVPPVAIKQDIPRYPGAVRPGGITGVVEVVIDTEGGVESAVMLVSTAPAYDKLLLTAANRWLYYPATVDGKPVKFRKRIQVTINEPTAQR